ncbi:MAG: MBL fold metallo-hydrolase [Acidobacteria bacterium]|nr:MAG: MBL fold metallo-hydrolase [Acidobacteriota bacterium]
MKVTFLGTGTSTGVPVIGCSCRVCVSDDPRNRRLRPSILLEWDARKILVDSSSDFRQQALRHRIDHLDAVLYTHCHADHVMGLDDLRIYNFRQRADLPVYGSAGTLEDLRRTFWYAFADTQEGGGKPRLDLRAVGVPFDLFGVQVVPVPLWHGDLEVFGYRIGSFAYCTDCNRIPPASLRTLEGLEVLVMDALRPTPHPTHFSLPETLALLADLKPKLAYLVHMSHDIEHRTTEETLPPSIHLAYDGLVLET